MKALPILTKLFLRMEKIALAPRMRRPGSLGAILACLVCWIACGGGSVHSVPPQVTLLSISVTPSTATVAAGLPQQYSASAHYSDGSSKDVTGSAAWSSSDTTVATVSNSGLATSLKQGSVSLTASLQSASGTTSLTVSPPALTSIAVTPNPASILARATQQLIATGTYTDGSLSDVSSTATWSSSSAAVNVNRSGLTRGLVPGKAIVQAAIGSINATVSLTVTTPYPRYAFASSSDGSISEYAIDASSGTIATQRYVIQPNEIYFPPTVESTGKYLLAVNTASNPSIATYQIGTDGHLTTVFGSPFGVTNGVGLSTLVADPVTNNLFGVTQNGIMPFSIDLAAGVPNAGTIFPVTNITALAIDPLGRFLYALQPTSTAGNILVFTIASDGSLDEVQGSPFPAAAPAFGNLGFAVDPTGRFLYELASNGISEYAVNSESGALTSAGSLVAAGSDPIALTISPTGTELLVSNKLIPNDQIWAFSVNSATGSLSPISGSPLSLGSAQSLTGVSFDPSGKFAFAAEFGSYLETFSVNPSTGALRSATKTLAKENAAPLILGGASGLSYSPQFAYTTNTLSASVSAFSADATGALTQLNNNTPYTIGSSALSVSVVPGVEVAVTDAAAGNVDYFPLRSDGTLGQEQSVASQGFPLTQPNSPGPSGIVVDPSGRFVYVVDAVANGMESFSTLGGLLSPLFPPSNFASMGAPVGGAAAYLPGNTPAQAIMDPSGTYLLTVSQFTQTINLFRADPNLGGLIDDVSFSLPPLSTPTGIAIDPSGYVVVSGAFGSAYIFTLDPINKTLVGPTIIPIPGGQLNSVTINPANHAVYFPFSIIGSVGPGGVAGYILTSNNGVPNLIPISGSPFSADRSPSYMSISGSFAYVTNFASNDVSLFNVDAASGALKLVGNTSLPLALGPVQVKVTGSFR